ncbi:MAG: META domain-containing protein [Sphingomonadaceae bacterium]|nr:META domain-containing protein [Sphingomonadaceae bacterium]
MIRKLLLALSSATLALCACAEARPEPDNVTTPQSAEPNATTTTEPAPAEINSPGEGYRAGGNEPFWQVRFIGSEMLFEDIGMERTARAPRPVPEVASNGWRYVASAGDRPFIVAVERRFCQDSMSARPFPHSVTVTANGSVFEGCGGDTASLLTGGEWSVAAIGGQPVARGSGPTMLFGADGSIGGDSTCNRYTASYEIAGDGGLAIGPAGGTERACAEPALNDQEARFYAALPRADRFDIAENGRLRLYAMDEVILEARR